MTYDLEDGLPRDCVCCNILFGSINAWKHVANIPSGDLWLKGFGNFIPHFIARYEISHDLAYKDHFHLTNIPFITKDKGDLKPWLMLMRGDFATITQGFCFLALFLHVFIIQTHFLLGCLSFHWCLIVFEKIYFWALSCKYCCHWRCKAFWGEINVHSQGALWSTLTVSILFLDFIPLDLTFISATLAWEDSELGAPEVTILSIVQMSKPKSTTSVVNSSQKWYTQIQGKTESVLNTQLLVFKWYRTLACPLKPRGVLCILLEKGAKTGEKCFLCK